MQTTKPFNVADNSFYLLAAETTAAIAAAKDGSSQKDQVEELMRCEQQFREAILKYKQSTEIYKKFIQHIHLKNKNLLSARPYFRESAVTFSKYVTPMIKQTIPEMTGRTPELRSAGIEALKAFHINYQFIRFIRRNWLGPFPKKAEAIFQRLDEVRNRLISLNFPLAINRAKIFYRKTPKGHLSLMDMIGICGVGLIAGIDKYVGEYTKVFNGVAIGRMTGYLIDSYSETLLHFFPSDKRILYKAHSIRGRQGVEEVDELAKAVNQSFSDDKKEGKSVPKEKIDTGSLNGLMTAASVVSADATSDGGEEGYGVYTYTAGGEPDAETRYSEREIWQKTVAAMSELSCLQRKVLRLKGVKI